MKDEETPKGDDSEALGEEGEGEEAQEVRTIANPKVDEHDPPVFSLWFIDKSERKYAAHQTCHLFPCCIDMGIVLQIEHELQRMSGPGGMR